MHSLCDKDKMFLILVYEHNNILIHLLHHLLDLIKTVCFPLNLFRGNKVGWKMFNFRILEFGFNIHTDNRLHNTKTNRFPNILPKHF